FTPPGVHPTGVGGGGGGGNRTAAKVAGGGRYRDYRTDEVIGVRQFQVALRRLRRLTSRQDEPPDELDVDGTIDATAQNAGRLQLAWRHSRRNDIKLLALFDVGGSMDPYVELCNRLFSALHQSTHLKAFKTYYFHNCVYEHLYLDARLERKRSHRTADVLRHHDRTWRLVLVGDASMAPSELLERDGIIFWGQSNSEPGIVWLERLARHFDRSAWLNPMPIQRWPSLYGTVQRIAEVFPMFELTLDGLDRAIDHLTGRRRVEPLPPSGVYRGR
ncbi:MAG: VWA domain-containing protein, partial [Clostridia bacterium]|nr:VWA domain-containing protein [Clostridia bacterium]